MKRSTNIVLGAVLLAAISSCSNNQPKHKDEWITGANPSGKTRDTLINNQHYRYYGAGWFLLANGMINPGRYQPSTLNQIRTPGHVPGHTRTGGFGSSHRSSSVHS